MCKLTDFRGQLPVLLFAKNTMNMRVGFLFLLLFSIHFNLPGQNERAFTQAITAGDVPALSEMFGASVDFTILDNQEILSGKAAAKKLIAFLENKQLRQIKVIHEGKSKHKTSQYKVFKVITAQDTYRLFVYASAENKDGSIEEIRLDRF
jgi:hypothetical protein